MHFICRSTYPSRMNFGWTADRVLSIVLISYLVKCVFSPWLKHAEAAKMSYSRTAIAFGAGAFIGSGVAFAFFFRTTPLEKPTPVARRGKASYFKYGYPEASSTFHSYSEHSLVYDRSRRIPLWVSETLTRTNATSSSTANRNKCTFRPDPSVPTSFSSSNEDYRKSGWSRGHMAAAGNRKHSQQAMDDTFFLTNIIPQDVDNNSGYWNRLEMYCRTLTKQFEEIHVISGPLFLPQHDEESGTKYVKFKVIGDGKVAVPTHLFKVVLAEKKGVAPSLGVFVIPNEDIRKVPLTSFQVPLDQLEAFTGWAFFPRLDRSKVLDLCTNGGCKLISQDKVDMMILTNRLRSAKTTAELEQIWKGSGVKTDQTAENVFNKRKAELGV